MASRHQAFLTSLLISLSTVFVPAPASAQTATINATKTVNPFAKEMLGVAHGNWDHSWGKPFPGEVPGLAAIYQAGHIGLIRYAGGLWANGVGWDRTLQKTPYTQWTKNNLVYYFHYGIDEIDSLAKLGRESGARVMIQVNISNNDPQMWADMVRYTNLEKGYNFKYWELGNELDHECINKSTSCLTPLQYQQRVATYTQALKAVDPTITVIAGVPASGHDFYRTQDYSGNTTAMSAYLSAAVNSTTTPSALSYHWYTDCNASEPKNLFQYTYDLPLNAWQHTYSRRWSQIAPQRIQHEIIPSGRNFLIGVTELNVDACNFNRAPLNSNHLTALWYADVLGRLAYAGTDFVTWYEGYGNQNQGYPSVAASSEYPASPSDLYLRPTYYTTFLYGNYFGDQMVEVTGLSDPNLSLYASLDSKDPGTLKLIAINFSGTTQTPTLTLNGFSATQAAAFEMKNPNPLSQTDASNGPNHGTTLNGISLSPATIATAKTSIQGKTVSLVANQLKPVFAPYSVTALILKTTVSLPTATPVSVQGDFDQDGDTDYLDYRQLVKSFHQSNCTLNLLGTCLIDLFDYNRFLPRLGK